MIMLYCTCNVSSLNDLKNILATLDIKNYQILESVTGKSFRGNPRLNTPVWPGYNSSVFIQTEKDTAEKIRHAISVFNADIPNENEFIYCFQYQVDEYIC